MHEPSKLDVKKSRVITPQEITKLEELWITNPKAKFEDLNAMPAEKSQ